MEDEGTSSSVQIMDEVLLLKKVIISQPFG
jgi:hypothetical protein